MFNAEKVKNECIAWIREFFDKNGNGCNAVVGISGGKDSSVAAALCVEALGAHRVIGVLMPQGEQHDIDMAYKLVNHLGIKHYEINVKDAVEGVLKNMPRDLEVSVQSKVNLPPRIRMSILYFVSQSLTARNTYNGITIFTVVFKKIFYPSNTIIFNLYSIKHICHRLLKILYHKYSKKQHQQKTK